MYWYVTIALPWCQMSSYECPLAKLFGKAGSKSSQVHHNPPRRLRSYRKSYSSLLGCTDHIQLSYYFSGFPPLEQDHYCSFDCLWLDEYFVFRSSCKGLVMDMWWRADNFTCSSHVSPPPLPFGSLGNWLHQRWGLKLYPFVVYLSQHALVSACTSAHFNRWDTERIGFHSKVPILNRGWCWLGRLVFPIFVKVPSPSRDIRVISLS